MFVLEHHTASCIYKGPHNYYWHTNYTSETMAVRVSKHYTELIKEGLLAEREGLFNDAISLYEEAIKQNPIEDKPYNRLMTLYRQEKEYEKELKVINKALKLYQDFYDHRPERIVGKNSKAARLSKALLQAVDGKKKKSEPYYPAPVPAWIKRKSVVEKKLGK
jgi:tetratricopeptide (TPR) repeat protein